MKHRSKRFLGILLSLVIVLGLVPGMSLTAYAAPTEELLTTITATGTEQASYSTANVATVSFSNLPDNGSSYTAIWGWWGYGWSATVNAAEGYNITKCIFYDDANRTATDSEAPFVVETTEEDKTPKVNGTPILAWTSKGIKKIEVYGYATPAHTHDFTYSASGATITATCTAGCPDSYDTTPATLTIAAAGGTYDGTTAYSATVTNNIPAVTGDTVGDVAYYKVDTQDATTGGVAQASAPTGAAYYYASVTLTSGDNSYTAVKAFTVAKADPTAPTDLTATYGQKLSDVVLPTGWTWADSTQSVGNVVDPAATFKANFAGDDNYNAASNVDVTVTVSKAANPATVSGTAAVTRGGQTVDLSNNVTLNGATGDVSYAIDGEANGCSLSGSVLTSGDITGTVTVNVTVAADGNYEALAATPITVTVSSLNVKPSDVPAGASVEVDGVEYQFDPDTGAIIVPDASTAKIVESFVYNNGGDVHSTYPTGLMAWLVTENADGQKTTVRLPELDDIMQYSGFSIRVTGNRGIRMITSVPTEKRNALISAAALDGFTLEEYGTVIGWAGTLNGASLTIDNAAGHAYAYKRGVDDAVFKTEGGLTQYTNVLVNFTDEQVKEDLIMRSYMILSKDGETYTLYGGAVQRSLGYVAYQNRAAFQPGTAAYEYVWALIRLAYGDTYDAEYRG